MHYTNDSQPSLENDSDLHQESDTPTSPPTPTTSKNASHTQCRQLTPHTEKHTTPITWQVSRASRSCSGRGGHGRASALPVVADHVRDLETTSGPWQADAA